MVSIGQGAQASVQTNTLAVEDLDAIKRLRPIFLT